MRKFSIVLTLLPLFGLSVPAEAQCLDGNLAAPGCAEATDLHLSSALMGAPPLVWSASQGMLVSPPSGRAGWAMGETIPLGDIVGQRIASVGGVPQQLDFNSPDSFPGAEEPGVILMPLYHPHHRRTWRHHYD